MPAATVQNPPAQTESKTAKKKKAKAAAAAADRTDSPAPAATPEKAGSVSGSNDPIENAYIRDLKKNIRNTSKKISNASKTQALIAENKDKSIDQLIAAKIINADQKRQVDNKPALEAELARYEEQLAQVQKIDDDWRAIASNIKTDTEKTITEKFEKEKAETVAELKAQAEADREKAVQDGFLAISQFLRLAAHQRQEASESDEDGAKAVEGILSSLYVGDSTSVASMVKLYRGTDDAPTGVSGEALSVTYADVKGQAVALYDALHPADIPAGEVDAEAAPVEPSHLVETDPTIANAGLTEIDAGTDTTLTNGHDNAVNGASAEVEASIPNADVGDNAANAAAESQWDTGNDLAASQEWVEVQKPAEAPQIETAPNAVPAVPDSQSWADDHPEPSAEASPPAEASTPADPNDGFQSVQRNRGRGDREGGARGGRGGYRGRGGPRGDARGRGRGGPRGGPRGGSRGA